MAEMVFVMPAGQVQPVGTAPVAPEGHAAGAHVDAEYGDVVVAKTEPLKPALQAHPVGTDRPLLLTGQVVATHEDTKYGDVVEETTLPLKPALQLQPAGTLAPLLLEGHATAVQVDV